MQRLLIILGLVIIPFYEIFLHALPFVHGVAPDSRVPKEILALIFSLSIGLLAVWNGNIRPIKNKFLLIIPIYLLFNLVMAPYAHLNINNNEVGDFYFWKPFAEVLCFTFMIIGIASFDGNYKEILRVMVICGVVMAAYVILQKLGLDQFWMTKTEGEFTSVRQEALGGNLGQPTIVASWLVIMVPLAMYLRKWWMAIIIIIAVLLTQSAMAAGALGLVFIMSIFYRWPSFRLIIIILFLGTSIFILFDKPIHEKIINRMDGRDAVWMNVLGDIRNGEVKNSPHKYSITGVGLGEFSFMFPVKHPSHYQFMQAHNDILEFIYNCGIIGGILLLGGIFLIFKGALVNISPICFSILLSFIAVLFCSLGSFPFQLGAHQFYSAILVGLLNNEKIIRRV